MIPYYIIINVTRMKLPKLLESDSGPAIGSPHGDIFTGPKKDPTRLRYQSSVPVESGSSTIVFNQLNLEVAYLTLSSLFYKLGNSRLHRQTQWPLFVKLTLPSSVSTYINDTNCTKSNPLASLAAELTYTFLQSSRRRRSRKVLPLPARLAGRSPPEPEAGAHLHCYQQEGRLQ